MQDTFDIRYTYNIHVSHQYRPGTAEPVFKTAMLGLYNETYVKMIDKRSGATLATISSKKARPQLQLNVFLKKKKNYIFFFLKKH